ncbi:MAG TPA: cation diffusion facilitator family transporter [Acetobacteraceae bacterium]|nr:cation diffusion facilitator family transporter [Acetobacteraceae bacterium]
MESPHHDRSAGSAPRAGHHDHVHDHGAAARHGRAFALGAAINLTFVLVQAGFGLAANSMALLADAAHNFADVLGLLLAWGAAWLALRPPTRRRTYGWGRSSILAALVNAMVLLIGVGAIGVEALRRLAAPEPVATLTVMLVAAIGIVVNGGSALLFLRDRAQDLNIRTQFVHLAADALVSAGVVGAAAAIRVTGWLWLDPVASLAIVAAIVAGTWGVLRHAVDLAMDAVPAGVTRDAVQDWLAGLPGVVEVHDLHIWALSTTETALTAHLVHAGDTSDRRLHDLSAELARRFGIGHVTLQLESDADAALCRLRPNDVV